MNILTNVYKRCEIVLHSTKTYGNPFVEVEIDAVFTHEDGTVVTLPGFWNGENEWKVRFASEKTGVWTYKVTCTDNDNASLFDEGTITVQAAEPKNDLEKHGYVVLKPNMRHMTYADGTPFFYLGDTHWQMPDYEHINECNCPGCNCGSQFKHLADDRVKKGFTVYQTYFDAAESDGGGNPRRYHWWTDKYTKINPQAFNETMDIMMEYLADNGITVAMGFGVHTSTVLAYNSDPNPMLLFARYCVARYACYPVIWITGQEITDERYNTFEIYKQAGALVGKLDGYHRPNGAHMYPMGNQDPRARSLDESEWHQWFTLQAGHGGFGALKPRSFYQSYYLNPKVKPFIETECQYEDIYCGGFNGHDASRLGAYQAVISGSAGFTYGVTGVWAMGWNETDDRGWLQYSPEPWYIGMNKPGSTEMLYMRNFFEYVGWADLEPSFDHTFGAFEIRKYVSICHKDQDIIIYYLFSADNEPGTLLNLKKNTTYQARWFDTVTGKFIDLPSFSTETGEYPLPLKPSNRDWLLLLNTEDLGAYETEVYPQMPTPCAADSVVLGDEIAVKDVKVSAFEDGHGAECVIDGNPETYWAPLEHATCVTFDFDLGKAEELGYIDFESNNKDMMYIRFRIYGSNDGKNYDLIAERPAMTVAVGGQYPKFYDYLNGQYRYVRVFINSTASHEPKRQLTKIGFFKK